MLEWDVGWCESDAPSHACVAFAGGQSSGPPPASFHLVLEDILPAVTINFERGDGDDLERLGDGSRMPRHDETRLKMAFGVVWVNR